MRVTHNYHAGAMHRPIGAVDRLDLLVAGVLLAHRSFTICACGEWVHVDAEHAARDFYEKHIAKLPAGVQQEWRT